MHSSAPAGLEPGSFRDPESRVFYSGDDVYRALSSDGLSDFEALEATGLLDGERVVGTERASDVAALPRLRRAGWRSILTRMLGRGEYERRSRPRIARRS